MKDKARYSVIHLDAFIFIVGIFLYNVVRN